MTDLAYEDVGLGGAFAPTDRGQPMKVWGSSRPFYPFSPCAEEVDIETIAHALSLVCRYGGHCREFYSVAEHCVRVSRLCASTGLDVGLEGLLHDANEAYLGDCIKPLKRTLGWARIEKPLDKVIAERFGLVHPWPSEVVQADLILLATEKRDLVDADGDWGPLPEPLGETIRPWSSAKARERFLATYQVLRRDDGS